MDILKKMSPSSGNKCYTAEGIAVNYWHISCPFYGHRRTTYDRAERQAACLPAVAYTLKPFREKRRPHGHFSEIVCLSFIIVRNHVGTEYIIWSVAARFLD